MIIWSASAIGAAWVLNRRRMYRRSAAPLEERQRMEFEPYFGDGLLSRVRVMRVERICNPLVYRVFPLVGRKPPMDLSLVSGMAFADTVVLAQPKRGVDPACLLFHELVHIAQYELLGVRAFVGAYLRGWLDGGRDYFAIPLERQAFELQDRFAASTGAFDVRSELCRLMNVSSEAGAQPRRARSRAE